MKEDRIRQAIGEIDDRLIEDAEKTAEPKKAGTRRFRLYAVAAACVLVAVALAVLGAFLIGRPAAEPESSSESADVGTSSGFESAPEAGEESVAGNESGNKPEPDTPEYRLLSSSSVDDEDDVNISSALHYSAYRSKTDANLVYIERNCTFRTEIDFGFNPDRFVIDMNGPSPLEIIDLAEEEFKGMTIRYHCEFESLSQEAREALADALSVQLTDSPETSPYRDAPDHEITLYRESLYLTKQEIDVAREADIGNIRMDIGLLDMSRLIKNFPDVYNSFLPANPG